MVLCNNKKKKIKQNKKSTTNKKKKKKKKDQSGNTSVSAPQACLDHAWVWGVGVVVVAGRVRGGVGRGGGLGGLLIKS